MKKVARFLLPILLVNSTLLFGCKNNQDNRTVLTYGDMNADHVTKISHSQLDSKINNKEKIENFMVTVASPTCGCWATFRDIIEPYIKEHHLVCYYLEAKDFQNLPKFGLHVEEGITSFAIFENGELKYSLTSDKDELKKKDAFASFMEKAVLNPKAYFISRSNYDEILESRGNYTIYIMRSGCGDCSAAGSMLLKPYLEKNRDCSDVYMLDCEEYISLETEEYEIVKDDLLLSTTFNPNFGYNKGVFPTFLTINNGNPISGAVCYNDKVEKINDKYVITDTYYTNTRKQKLTYLNNFTGTSVLEGHEIPESEIIGTYYWDHEPSNAYYGPLLEAYLNYSLNLD